MKQGLARLLCGGFLFGVFSFKSSLNATVLTAIVWADEAYEVYVSHSDSEAGTLFLEGSGGEEGPNTGKAELVEGAIQYLHILVQDDQTDLSALIGSFTLDGVGFIFPNLFNSMSTDLDYWKVSRHSWESSFDFISDLGVNGTNPFGQKAGINADAHYLWSDGERGNRYFTLAILPTNSSPRRFVVGLQPVFNSGDELETKTEGVPNTLAYQDGLSKALAVSYPGRVGARVEESTGKQASDNFTHTWAEFDSPDFVVTSNGSETEVDLSLNFQLKGVLKGGVGLAGASVEVSSSTNEISAYARIGREPLFFGFIRVEAKHEVGTQTPASGITKSESGFLSGLFPDKPPGGAGDNVLDYEVPIDQQFTTPVYTVPVGEAFTVKLNFDAISQAVTDQGQSFSFSDFTGGLSFPTEGPVFNVPDGFTVNSISATIRDNRFEGDLNPTRDPDKILVPGIFMQAGGIVGESQAEGHEDWIDLVDVSSGLYQPTQGLTRRRSSVIHEDVGITKAVDKSSPKLIEALARGTVLEELTIEHTKQVSKDLWTRFEFLLSHALVTDYHLSGFPDEPLPLESFSFNYEKIDWIYELCNSDGVGQGRVEANWDVVSDTGGSSSTSGDNDPPSMDPVGNQSVDPASTSSVDLIISDRESDEEDLEVTVSTSRPDLIGDLEITGTGANRKLSFKTSSLFSGFASIAVTLSDGKDSRTTAIPILIDVEMTPYEGYVAAYFGEEELDNPQLTSPIRDPDADAIPTVVEYLLGTNPAEHNHPSEAIQVDFNLNGENCHCTLDFNKRLDDPNVQGYFWVSDNLKDWTRMDTANPLYEETVTEGQNPLFGQAQATIAFPDLCKEPKFIRFQVQDVF